MQDVFHVRRYERLCGLYLQLLLVTVYITHGGYRANATRRLHAAVNTTCNRKTNVTFRKINLLPSRKQCQKKYWTPDGRDLALCKKTVFSILSRLFFQSLFLSFALFFWTVFFSLLQVWKTIKTVAIRHCFFSLKKLKISVTDYHKNTRTELRIN